MPQNALTLNSDEADQLVLKFNRENFSEFISSLLSTPRQESRRHEFGFDLTKSGIETLLEKINYKLHTDHDVVHNEAIIDVFSSGNQRVTFSSYEHFSNISHIQTEDIERIAITISAVIPFNRVENEKSYEKQIIYISVECGNIGEVEIEIRSTEITWQIGYFEIVKMHFEEISQIISSKSSNFLDKFLFPHRFFYRSKERSDLDFTRGTAVFFSIFMPIFFAITIISSSIEDQRKNEALIYNPENGEILRASVSEMINEFGWDEAVDKIIRTENLIRYHDVKFSADFEPTPSFFGLINYKIWLGIFLFISLYVLASALYARELTSEKIGRIFLRDENLPPRPKPGVVSVIWYSLATGAIGSLLANTVWYFFV